jgi:bifunctional ADP-heptose synthase (sugar kinase/adenylyltransferase)
LSHADLLASMQAWSQARLIVLGDTIVDQYAACEAIGMSAEAPPPWWRPMSAPWGRRWIWFRWWATMPQPDLVQEELRVQGIGDGLTRDPSRPTTFKKRYEVENQKQFRVSRLEQHNLDAPIEEQLIARLEALASHAQGIVVSDFVYRVVTPQVLAVVQELARRHGLLLFGDLQCSSQVGSITRFQHFSS